METQPHPEVTDALFWTHVDRAGPIPAHSPELGECWTWTAYTSKQNGYGRVRRAGRTIETHIYSYYGLEPVPAGLELDHLCRNRPCVRPSHLEPVTHAINMDRIRLANTEFRHSRNAVALADRPADSQPSLAADTVDSSPKPITDRPWLFRAGHDPRRNTNGRPKRGESLPEKLRTKVEKEADKIVEAVYQRLLREDAVGNRAFADVRDTLYGIPKQTLIIEQPNDPLIETLQASINRTVIDGESRLLT